MKQYPIFPIQYCRSLLLHIRICPFTGLETTNLQNSISIAFEPPKERSLFQPSQIRHLIRNMLSMNQKSTILTQTNVYPQVLDVHWLYLNIPPLFALSRLAPTFIPFDLISPTDRWSGACRPTLKRIGSTT